MEIFSLEAEHGVLGAMMLAPEHIDVISADLKPADFYYSNHRQIFEAILDLRKKGRPVDLITVAERIGSFDDGDNPLPYVAEIHKNTPSAANAVAYAQIVLERSTARALLTAGAEIQEIAKSGASAEDMLSRAAAELESIQTSAGDDDVLLANALCQEYSAELDRRAQLDGSIDGLTTGIDSLDERLMGLKGGQLIVIAARPGLGKTSLVMNIADHNAVKCQKNVLVFSLEMSREQLMDKSVASLGLVPLKQLKTGKPDGKYWPRIAKATAMINESGLAVYARAGATISRIRAAARRHKMKHGLDLLVVDHIGLVDVADAKASTVQRISEITRQLKLLATELDIPIIALSQLNRELEKRPDKRPICSDLRDSGSIEQDADVILFIYRDEVYNPISEARGIAEIISGKVRDGECGTDYAVFMGWCSLFKSADANDPVPTANNKTNSILD